MSITSLVTGGAGFIGSHVVDHLINKGHRVIVLDDLSGGFRENVNSNAILKIGSITNSELVDSLFDRYNFDYVYHLAAYAAEGLSHFVRKFNYENNLIGSINLINASVNHKIKCFVFTSSIAVYGDNELPLTETQTPSPNDPYGIAKYAIELDLLNAKKMFDLNSVIFRPHNVYGERQNIGDPYRNVIGIFMNQALQNKPLTLFGDGSQTRAFTYISDVAPYIADTVDIPETYNQVFNIGSDQPYSLTALAEKVSEAILCDVPIVNLKKRNEAVHAFSNHDKFKSIFEPKGDTALEDGLVKMAQWVKSTGARTSEKFSQIEITDNLPDSWK